MPEICPSPPSDTAPFDMARYDQELVAICTAYRVRQLEIFGSASRSDFDQTHSDIDVLVDFIDQPVSGAFERYFGLKEALEQLFQRIIAFRNVLAHGYDTVSDQTVCNLVYFTTNHRSTRIQHCVPVRPALHGAIDKITGWAKSRLSAQKRLLALWC